MSDQGVGRAGRRRAAMAAVLFASTMLATAAIAQERTYAFDLSPEPLADALRDYGRIADRQLIFSPELVRGVRAPAVKGRLDASAALDQLLAGTNLAWRSAPSGGIMIVRRAEAGPPVQTAAASADAEPSREIEGLEVVGSRLARADDGPAPVTIMDRKKIDDLGVNNLADVLSYLPQQPFSFAEGFNAGAERYVQLRGLAAGTTLVLINGRRVVPGAGSISRSVFDMNSIPLTAVERVEVLADSASAVYGADAVGGVVNIVLRSRIDRPTFDAYYGAADGGGAEKRLALSTGGHTDRAQGALVLDYFKRDPLYGADRDVSSNADYRRFGSIDRRALTADPGNICAATGTLPGLGVACAAVPAGSPGVGLTPSSFAATAGQQNFTSLRRQASVIPESERYAAMANGSYDITSHVTAFGELMYADQHDEIVRNSPVVTNGLVAAGNPFNPFGVPVRATFQILGIAPITDITTQKSYREVLGLRGGLGSWDWEASLVAAQGRATSYTINNTNSSRVTAALAATTASQALNPFQDGPGGDPALLLSLIADPSTNTIRRASRELQGGGFARGELFQLPAGPILAVLGAEWRKESMALAQPAANINVVSGTAKRTSWSTYGELRAPLIDSDTAPLGRVELSLAGRYDHYSDFGGAFNAEYGLEWRPVRSLLVRGSYGESYRAPGLFQLYAPKTSLSGVNFSSDPARGGLPFVATFVSGGNPDLDAETSTASNFGFVWQPAWIGRPRLSVSVWQVKQEQRIVSSFSFLLLLANESLFPNRVVRAAPSAADVAAGRPGPITSVDVSNLNLGSLDTHGVDVELSANFETTWGRWTPSLAVTRVDRYTAADFPTTPAVARVGVANVSGSIPRWKGVGTLTWSAGAFAVTADARYVASYADVATNNVRNGLKVKAQTLVDLQASADLGELFGTLGGLSEGTRLRVGANNLFDEAPPFSDVIGQGYDPSQAMLRQRFVYVALTKAF